MDIPESALPVLVAIWLVAGIWVIVVWLEGKRRK